MAPTSTNRSPCTGPAQPNLYYHANGLFNVAALTRFHGTAQERYEYEAFGSDDNGGGWVTVRTAMRTGTTGRSRGAGWMTKAS